MAALSLHRYRCLGSSINKCITFVQTRNFSRSLSAMGAYDADFNKAKERLSSLKEDPGNQVKLQIYGLFKQATQGKCNAPKPGMMDFVGKAKWEAWNTLGDISQDEAKKKYIDLVDGLAAAEKPAEQSAEGKTEAAGKFETLQTTVDNGAYRIMLNRPGKKNAINFQMYEDLIVALKEAADDNSIVLATVTGSGDYYCSGNDLSNFMNIPPDGIKAMAEDGGRILERFVSAFIDFPKPLIGLINGPAVGISVTILGLFDAVYASDRASFNTPFSALGQSPEGCSSYIFPRLMGALKASELLLFNKKITAVEAYERNLVTEVFPDQSFKKESESRVQQYSKLPKMSLQKSKNLSREVMRETLHRVNKMECTVLVERWQSEECFKAIMNFFTRKDSKL